LGVDDDSDTDELPKKGMNTKASYLILSIIVVPILLSCVCLGGCGLWFVPNFWSNFKKELEKEVERQKIEQQNKK
jgi:hypothetical protein